MVKPFIYNDKYAKKAKKEGYLARSAYKLKEILDEFDIIKPGNIVLDIGSAPGGWLQVASRIVGKSGKAIGVDISPIKAKASNIVALQGDIFSPEIEAAIERNGPYDAIISDAAPNTTGIKDQDHVRSCELVERSLELSEKYLKKGGCFAAKIFQGPDARPILKLAQALFCQARATKPKASRDRSFEQYIIGINKL